MSRALQAAESIELKVKAKAQAHKELRNGYWFV
jgi:hypothetical protein